MTPDSELLANFARTNSEDAFAELVRRHVDLVYSAVLRQVGSDAHLANDVAQSVFTDLAKKAHSLSRRENLTGWLYTSAHFAASKMVRGETRRRDREERFMREVERVGTGIPPIQSPNELAEWQNLQPALDEAMHELKETDREAILLRYFENRPFAEVGARLGLNENAARMRVERALEKLRAVFARRGMVTTSACGAAIAANAVQMAPAGLAAALTTASAVGAGTGTFTLLKIMTATQFKIGISAIIVAGATTALVAQHQAQKKLRGENESLTEQMAQLTANYGNLSNRLATAADSKSLAGDQLTELLKLRGEVSGLRQQASQFARLQKEYNQLQAQQRRPKSQATLVDAPAQERQAGIDKMNQAKQGVLAFHMFAQDHQGQFPTNFAQASLYLQDNGMALVESNFDLVCQLPINEITSPSATIVLREKQAWQTLQGKWMKAYGFADGHSELHTEPSGNFDDWEARHIISPPSNQ